MTGRDERLLGPNFRKIHPKLRAARGHDWRNNVTTKKTKMAYWNSPVMVVNYA